MSEASSTNVNLGSGNDIDSVFKGGNIVNTAISALSSDALSRTVGGKGIMDQSITSSVSGVIDHHTVNIGDNIKGGMESLKSIQAEKKTMDGFSTPLLQAAEGKVSGRMQQ